MQMIVFSFETYWKCSNEAITIGTGHGLVMDWQQSITLTSYDPFHWMNKCVNNGAVCCCHIDFILYFCLNVSQIRLKFLNYVRNLCLQPGTALHRRPKYVEANFWWMKNYKKKSIALFFRSDDISPESCSIYLTVTDMLENKDSVEFGDSIANLANPIVIEMDTMPVSPYLQFKTKYPRCCRRHLQYKHIFVNDIFHV